MNDTDSLLVFRLQRLRNQPKTVRGRCILFYASLIERPCARITLAAAMIAFVMVHCLAFCSMVYACYGVSGIDRFGASTRIVCNIIIVIAKTINLIGQLMWYFCINNIVANLTDVYLPNRTDTIHNLHLRQGYLRKYQLMRF
jgi:hypothetical protein